MVCGCRIMFGDGEGGPFPPLVPNISVTHSLTRSQTALVPVLGLQSRTRLCVRPLSSPSGKTWMWVDRAGGICMYLDSMQKARGSAQQSEVVAAGRGKIMLLKGD